METRTVKITLDMERFAVAGNHKQAQDAIGRMCSYAFNAYSNVHIMHDGKHFDMIAVYTHETHPQKIVIGSIWDKVSRTYSYHS